jgi:Zn-finger nucleic acid-binding protein
MKCPACFNELSKMQVGNVEVDVCHGGCGGVWFDAFELQRVDEETEAGEPLLHIPSDPKVIVDGTRKRDCPVCDEIKLKRRFFSPKRQVEIDECPNCGGYWLDAGELAKIRAEKSQPAAAKSTISPEMIRYIYRMKAQQQGEV